MATIVVKLDTLTPLLYDISSQFRSPAGFAKVCSRTLLKETRTFYREKASGFWGQFVSGATDAYGNDLRAWEDTSEAGKPRISISGQAAAILLHKRDGGRIIPKTSKMLAIPAHQEAREAGSPRLGRTPPLKLVVFGGGRTGRGIAALVEADQFRRRAGKKDAFGFSVPTWERVNKRERVWYWLKRFVDQQPDLDALPSPDRLGTAIVTAAGEYLQNRIKNRQGAAPTS